MRKIYVKFYILLGYIICFIDRKGKEMRFKNLAIFYVNMILEGNITFDEVPKLLKKYVAKVAVDLGVWEIIEGSKNEEDIKNAVGSKNGEESKNGEGAN